MKKLTLSIALLSIAFSSNAQEIDFSGAPSHKKQTLTPQSEIDAYTSVQKKFQNQIVFSNSKIVKDEENSSTFISEWNLGDPLYYRVYHENTVERHANNIYEQQKLELPQGLTGATILTVLKVDGKEIKAIDKPQKLESIKTRLTFSGTAFEPGSFKGSGDIATAVKYAYNYLGSNLKNGKHTFEFETYVFPESSPENMTVSNRTELLSKGKLLVNVTDEGRKKYNDRGCYIFDENPLEMEDPILVQEIVALFNNSYDNKKVAYANITSNDWGITRNKLGIILDREIKCLIIYTDDKGQTFWREARFEQPYDGSKYQKLKLVATSADILNNDEPIAPSCVKWYLENDKNYPFGH